MFKTLKTYCFIVLLVFNAQIVVADAGNQPRIHLLANHFIDLWDNIKTETPEQQVSAVKQRYFSQFADFFQYKVNKWHKQGAQPEQEIKNTLQQFSKIYPNFKTKANEISHALETAVQNFVKTFPDLDKDFDVYVVHSFGEMDGGTRNIDGKFYFILGIDGMVKYHQGFETELPFFHHELFHVYHGQYFEGSDALWSALWQEGLATYVSEQLNPKCSKKELLLNLPDGLIARVDNNLNHHFTDLLSKLESREEQDYRTYFLIRKDDSDIVMRSGYYLGYLIAKEIGKTKSLKELARLNSDALFTEIKAITTQLANS